MNTTMEGIDARGYLIGWLKGVTSMTAADIRAIPDEKWTGTFGGCTRPTNELMADAVALLIWTAGALRGEAPTAAYEESLKGLAGDISTKDAAIARLNEAADDLASAIAGASDETMNKVMTAPWGMDAPLFMIAQISVAHIWYHDGQLNYIHCLLGDNKIYWMGG